MLASQGGENVQFDQVEERKVMSDTRLRFNERRCAALTARLGCVRVSIRPIPDRPRWDVQVTGRIE
jgi:hypothetical protein